MTKSDSHSWNISILVTVLASYLCQVFVMDAMLIRRCAVFWRRMPDVRQQGHSHPVGNVLAEVLRKVVCEPHDCLMAVAIPMDLLMLAAKFLRKIEEFLPTLAMCILVSTHGAAIVSILVKLVKLWCLEQHHHQLEALQLHCSPFCALLGVAILLNDRVQLFRHGPEVITLVCGTRHLGSSPAQIIGAWIWRHVGRITGMHGVRWIAVICATNAGKSSSLHTQIRWDVSESICVDFSILDGSGFKELE